MASPILFVQDDLEKCSGDALKSAASNAKADYESGRLKKCGEEHHLLIIGRNGSGKTSLAGVLIEGKSAEGTFGSKAGTTQLTSTPFERDDITYHVHDTRGLGSSDVVAQKKIEDEVKQIYDNNNCLIIVCIRWDDRLDNDITLKVCNSLGADVWSKAIIAITHCDILPPNATATTDQNIKQEKENWKMLIQQQLHSFEVNEDHIKAVKICFTSHTDVPNCKVEPYWVQNLLIAILLIAPKLQGAFNFIISLLQVSATQSNKEHANESKNQTINSMRQLINFGGEAGDDIGGEIANTVDVLCCATCSFEDISRATSKAFCKVAMGAVILWLYVQKGASAFIQ